MSAGYGRRKPVRPAPRRAMSLWRGCLWATAMGWNKGWNEPGGETSADDQRRTKGILQGSRPGTHEIMDAGRCLTAGNSLDPIHWADVANGYDLINGQTTLACMIRFEAVPAASGRILAKRNSAQAASAGMDLVFNLATGTFMTEWSNGAAEERIIGTTAIVTTISYMLIARHSRVSVDLWVNGIREAINAAPAVIPGNNDSPVTIFNNPALDDVTINCRMSMAAIWTRAISDSEIRALNTDPYVMWLPLRRPEYFGGLIPSARGDGCKCGGPWLHAWSGLS